MSEGGGGPEPTSGGPGGPGRDDQGTAAPGTGGPAAGSPSGSSPGGHPPAGDPGAGAVEPGAGGDLAVPGAGGEPDVPGGGESVETLAAALRRDAADLQVYAEVLSGSLAEALPPGSVVLERKRSMGDRMAGREGRVERAEVSLEDHERLILTMTRGRPAAEVAKVVRGVILSRTEISVEEWTLRLAEAVARRARSDERARAALQRLVLGG
jgi:hypothetical protein